MKNLELIQRLRESEQTTYLKEKMKQFLVRAALRERIREPYVKALTKMTLDKLTITTTAPTTTTTTTTTIIIKIAITTIAISKRNITHPLTITTMIVALTNTMTITTAIRPMSTRKLSSLQLLSHLFSYSKQSSSLSWLFA